MTPLEAMEYANGVIADYYSKQMELKDNRLRDTIYKYALTIGDQMPSDLYNWTGEKELIEALNGCIERGEEYDFRDYNGGMP